MTKAKGFTIIEVLIAITVGAALLGVVLSIYSLAVRSQAISQNRSELTQNSRTILDRLARELRQARAIATTLPAGQIEFEDGHSGTLQYLLYFLNNTDLKLQRREYYFADAPAVLVPGNAADDFGNPPQVRILSEELVGQYVQTINFSGGDLITIDLTLYKSPVGQTSRTTVYGRNF